MPKFDRSKFFVRHSTKRSDGIEQSSHRELKDLSSDVPITKPPFAILKFQI
jgi:hypothetical protein